MERRRESEEDKWREEGKIKRTNGEEEGKVKRTSGEKKGKLRGQMERRKGREEKNWIGGRKGRKEDK